ncbi:TrlF family AAA-like ATPase [Kribbella sp. NPDC006257]|uniref:TrlF family AAA-like ATPase n=1 Tax=Kribbella sp. NPDC006257 TaxID=3156738 RepID=UPI00339FDB44
MDYPRGSEWRKWDLHVHTPESIINKYTGDDKWDHYLSELRNLPSDIKVLGINDYWFFDGYRKVLAEFKAGNLPNLENIFPVLEVRCDSFAGTDGHLSRLNLHLICDPLVVIDNLEAQLLPLLSATYRLTAGDAPSEWSEIVTRESLIRLGNKVIEAAPLEHRNTYPGPLETGFNNLNVSFEEVRKAILGNTSLRDHLLLGVGKAEWSKIKWTPQAAANKKHLVNSVDLVFTASPDRASFAKSLASLAEANVNHRLLHCSDAHSWQDSSQDNRLGNCLTWINADPTFKGLHQALQEYAYRVTVEERPPALARVAQSPQSTIAEVSIRPRTNSEGIEAVFDSHIPINSGFSVVIGNKGQGKSALLDVIAMAANSDRDADFSFLADGRFLSNNGREAGRYQATLAWRDGALAVRGLHERHDRSRSVTVDYLPQSLIEKVCSADPDSIARREFETEIERVLFRHLDESKRGTATSLSQYLTQQNEVVQSRLAEARREVAAQCLEVTDLEARQAELLAMDLNSREASLLERIRSVHDELDVVTDLLRTGGSPEQQELTRNVDLARSAEAGVIAEIDAVKNRQNILHSMTVEAAELLSAITSQIDSIYQASNRLSEVTEIRSGNFLEIDFDDSSIVAWQVKQTEEIARLSDDLASSGGLQDRLAVASRAVTELMEDQFAASAEIQVAVRRQTDLRAQLARLSGEPSEPDSLAGVRNLMAEVAHIPSMLAQAYDSLENWFKRTHELLRVMMETQKDAHQPAMKFVEANELVRSVHLEFDVDFRVRGFVDRWLTTVNRQKPGGFYDVSGRERDKVILDGAPLEDPEALFARLKALISRLASEGGVEGGASRSLVSIMRSGYTPESLLFSFYGLEWMESQYVIRSNGSELSELSPGQRGLVLLLFYLLVDKSERPLLLDQPEDNLDNQTVKNSLVPALRDAARRRQVIAVTHNPNFAVVGDADQIIVAEFDGSFTYHSGSLAAINVGGTAIDVLEGTRNAFVSRQAKYTNVVGD